MQELHPIGTVIKLKDRAAMIVGYYYREVMQKLLPQYIVLPHPEGYTCENDVRILSTTDVEIIADGYRNDAFVYFQDYFDSINRLAEKISVKDLRLALDEASEKKHQEVLP